MFVPYPFLLVPLLYLGRVPKLFIILGEKPLFLDFSRHRHIRRSSLGFLVETRSLPRHPREEVPLTPSAGYFRY